MLAAGVVFLGINLLSFGVAGLAYANIAFVLMAIFVATFLLREYYRLTVPPAEQPLGEATMTTTERLA